MGVQNFVRGANRSILSYSNFSRITLWMITVLFILLIVLNLGWFYLRTTVYERQLLILDATAHWQVGLQDLSDFGKKTLKGDLSKLNFITPHGKTVKVKTVDYLKSPYYRYSISIAKQLFYEGLKISLGIIFLILTLAIWLFSRKGKKSKQRKLIKGSQVVPVNKLNHLLKSKKMCSEIKIGKTCYPKETEVEHTLVLGGTRQGKSNFLKSNHQCVMNLGHRQIVFDLDGEYTELFYREGIDTILSPDDSRSAPWGLQFEYEDALEINECAFSLIPVGNKSGTDKFWIYSAQIIFSSVASQLQIQGKLNTEILLRYLFSIERNDIVNLLKGTEAETLVAEHLEKMTGSIKAVLATHIRCLKYLRDKGVKRSETFSIKHWMEDESKAGSTLFILTKEKNFDLFRPLISLWLNRAISCAMDLGRSFERRIWFRLDEVDTLQHLPSLKKGLTKGGKAGLCMILGAQSFGQFEENYSSSEVKTIFDNCHTRMYFSISGSETAKHASADLGEVEFEESREGISVSTGARGGNNVSSNQQHRVTHVVSYTELKNLPKRNAYLNLPGEWPVVKLKFNIFKKSKVAPSFVKAKLIPIKTMVTASKNEIQTLVNNTFSHTGFLENYKPNINDLKVNLERSGNFRFKKSCSITQESKQDIEQVQSNLKTNQDW